MWHEPCPININSINFPVCSPRIVKKQMLIIKKVIGTPHFNAGRAIPLKRVSDSMIYPFASKPIISALNKKAPQPIKPITMIIAAIGDFKNVRAAPIITIVAILAKLSFTIPQKAVVCVTKISAAEAMFGIRNNADIKSVTSENWIKFVLWILFKSG